MTLIQFLLGSSAILLLAAFHLFLYRDSKQSVSTENHLLYLEKMTDEIKAKTGNLEAVLENHNEMMEVMNQRQTGLEHMLESHAANIELVRHKQAQLEKKVLALSSDRTINVNVKPQPNGLFSKPRAKAKTQ